MPTIDITDLAQLKKCAQDYAAAIDNHAVSGVTDEGESDILQRVGMVIDNFGHILSLGLDAILMYAMNASDNVQEVVEDTLKTEFSSSYSWVDRLIPIEDRMPPHYQMDARMEHLMKEVVSTTKGGNDKLSVLHCALRTMNERPPNDPVKGVLMIVISFFGKLRSDEYDWGQKVVDEAAKLAADSVHAAIQSWKNSLRGDHPAINVAFPHEPPVNDHPAVGVDTGAEKPSEREIVRHIPASPALETDDPISTLRAQIEKLIESNKALTLERDTIRHQLEGQTSDAVRIAELEEQLSEVSTAFKNFKLNITAISQSIDLYVKEA